jgi:hypothetical protein
MQLLYELAALGRVAPVESETLDPKATNRAELVGFCRQAIERNPIRPLGCLFPKSCSFRNS